MANQKKVKLTISPLQQFDIAAWLEADDNSIWMIVENTKTHGRTMLVRIDDDGNIYYDIGDPDEIDLQYG